MDFVTDQYEKMKAAQAQAAQAQANNLNASNQYLGDRGYQGGILGGSLSAAGIRANTAPAEPGLQALASEMLGYVDRLESEMQALRSKLFGGDDCGRPAPNKADSLHGMVLGACQRLSSLIGEAATINGKL